MRQRATALVIRHGRLLIVRDKGHYKYSLPGGGIHKGEPTISAASRELYEELGLTTNKATRLRHCDFKGTFSEHKVCLIEASGEPHLRGHELNRYVWWNMKDSIPIYTHVKKIIERL
jgi:8-oxo-dGTP pyrophosphatase MutT (NUDIX family)